MATTGRGAAAAIRARPAVPIAGAASGLLAVAKTGPGAEIVGRGQGPAEIGRVQICWGLHRAANEGARPQGPPCGGQVAVARSEMDARCAHALGEDDIVVDDERHAGGTGKSKKGSGLLRAL